MEMNDFLRSSFNGNKTRFKKFKQRFDIMKKVAILLLCVASTTTAHADDPVTNGGVELAAPPIHGQGVVPVQPQNLGLSLIHI